MAEVVWTELAVDDLEALGRFYERWSPAYAQSIIDRLYHAVDVLHHHPQIGRVVQEVADVRLRELIVENHRIVYRVRTGRVDVIAVLHSRQDIRKNIARR